MLKFVLCALFAAAVAKPSVLLTPQLAPLTTTYIAPATTTITKQATGFISHGPLVYSSPLGYIHEIKKRGASLVLLAPSAYINKPAVTTYTAALPTYTTPVLHAATLPIASTHFIKKRSAPVLTTCYLAPNTYTAPLVSTLTASAPLVSSSAPFISSTPLVSQPVAYTTHLIKKRSAPLISTYTAPSVTYQSKLDLHGAPIIGIYKTPLTYSATIPAYTHVI